ncbi:hypothetical protein DPEC_G00175990 [Dallia pectoralis]|uniref:Uncharacterized protein n=1 Tax=Dallia pectoralis TaxID=75939 RepID=A0ACC2GEH3_DALPE|nr:hypothetical protein DPEC_G00175990 [Dallia pectoralis]
MAGVESRGVLRKISDMLEVILKRMDSLSKLDNTTSSDTRRLDELSSAINRFQPAGLVDRIQAIAQNVSNMAVRVEQILQNSIAAGKAVRDGSSGQCEVPRDPRYPDCPGKVDWMRARWTSDPCYAFYGVDGSDCSFLIYLSEVEWFCPPLAWRNHSSPPTAHTHTHWTTTAKRQAAFRTDLSSLLDQVGTGKESLSFMKRRMRRLAPQWATAAQRLHAKLRQRWREQKKILVHVGFLTEESGDVFSPKVLKGGPLGEMVQWADILTALHVLGHNLKISMSVKELQGPPAKADNDFPSLIRGPGDQRTTQHCGRHCPACQSAPRGGTHAGLMEECKQVRLDRGRVGLAVNRFQSPADTGSAVRNQGGIGGGAIHQKPASHRAVFPHRYR